MNIRKHGFSTSLSSARPGSDDSTGPPALRCSWTTVTDSELRLHRAQAGSLFRMFFYVFVRKIPMGYGMTHAAAHGDFSIDFCSHSFVDFFRQCTLCCFSVHIAQEGCSIKTRKEHIVIIKSSEPFGSLLWYLFQTEYPASRAISFTYGIELSVAAAMLSIGMFSLSRFMITVLPFSPCLAPYLSPSLPACLRFYIFGVPSKVSYILASFLYVL